MNEKIHEARNVKRAHERKAPLKKRVRTSSSGSEDVVRHHLPLRPHGHAHQTDVEMKDQDAEEAAAEAAKMAEYQKTIDAEIAAMYLADPLEVFPPSFFPIDSH